MWPYPTVRKTRRPPPHLGLVFTASGIQILWAVQWLLVIITGSSLAWSVWLWRDGQWLAEEAAQYEAASERVQEQNRRFAVEAARAGIEVSPEQMKTINRQTSFMAHVQKSRTLSWSRLLTHLEETVPPHISLSSVGLNFANSTIALKGTALTLKDLTEFVDQLEAHAAFSQAVLSEHHVAEAEQAVRSSDALRPLEFVMTVHYHATM
jgi:Tfp pilus assembly protein PilN